MPVLHMETDSVRSTGQALGSAAAILADQMFDLQVSINSLTNGWQGPASDIFVSEITPWLHQINQLVEEASTLRDRVFREADEWERVDSMMGGAAATLGALFADHALETARNVASPYDFTPREPDQSHWKWEFKPMDMIDYIPQGARSEGAAATDLSNAMSALSQLVYDGKGQSSDAYPLLQTIARERGLSYAQVQQDYQQFLYMVGDNPPTPTQRDNYWGTVQQLRFGTVVGDTVGMDAVFGALLSPTGGLVGPDEGYYKGFPIHDVADLLGVYNPESAMAYHGVYHDAAGYLQRIGMENVQYEYIIPGQIDPLIEGPLLGMVFKDHPELDGQIAGIVYWSNLLEPQRVLKRGQQLFRDAGNVMQSL